MPSFPEWRAEQASTQAENKRELMSFDFGTVVPQREEQSAKVAAEAKPTPKPDGEDSESKTSEEPRVLPMRTASGLSGSAAANVAPFPRPMREATKPAADTQPTPAGEKAADKPIKSETSIAAAELAPAAAKEASVAAAAPAEALLDAVVDLVQQQPGALSVFTSGASFIRRRCRREGRS